MKTLYCTTVTSTALDLIRRFEGDVVGHEAIICHYKQEEPCTDHNGAIIDGAYKLVFPNAQAICYTLSGEIAAIL